MHAEPVKYQTKDVSGNRAVTSDERLYEKLT